MTDILMAGGVALPPPASISVDDEIIWSEGTGRTLSGLMVGDVVAEKKKLGIKWGVLQESGIMLIRRQLVAGYFPIKFHDDGIDMTITGYRGTLTKEQIGRLGDGIFWYRSASVSIIQR